MSFSTFTIELSPQPLMADAPLLVLLDGEPIYEGSFVSGFSRSCSVAPGRHTLATTIYMGFGARRRRYTFDIDLGDLRRPQRLVARLEYSTLWGNFRSRLAMAPA